LGRVGNELCHNLFSVAGGNRNVEPPRGKRLREGSSPEVPQERETRGGGKLCYTYRRQLGGEKEEEVQRREPAMIRRRTNSLQPRGRGKKVALDHGKGKAQEGGNKKR